MRRRRKKIKKKCDGDMVTWFTRYMIICLQEYLPVSGV